MEIHERQFSETKKFIQLGTANQWPGVVKKNQAIEHNLLAILAAIKAKIMKHQRNTTGLLRHAQARHQLAIERTENAIRLLTQQGRPVNCRAVSVAASVSTAWLYQQKSIRKQIEQLRTAQPASQVARRPQVRASDASKDSIIAALRQRVKEVEAGNLELRKQLEVVYGELEKTRRHP
jgi:hypothetical protein